MQEKIKSILSDPPSRIKLFIVLILIGAILVIASGSFIPQSKDKSSDKLSGSDDYQEYTEQLEEKLCDTVSSIDGVGECRVMITLQSSNENVYAKNSQTKNDPDSVSDSKEYVVIDGENAEEPVLINEYFASVRGVAVVCSGGDIPAVKEKVIETVSSLFNISSNRISVSKIKNNNR